MQDILSRIENARSLDRAADTGSRLVAASVPEGPARDFLNGTWLGHPLHPFLTDVAAGLLMSSTVLDLFGRRARRTSQLLSGLGIATAVPTAASGAADWSDTAGPVRRVGLVHAAGNLAALGAYGAAMVARRREQPVRAGLWSLFGLAGLAATGYLGGHLAYRLGAGVDRTAFDELPDEWTPVLAEAELPEQEPALVSAGATDLLLIRSGGRISAIADKCTHQGGPLHEGDIDASRGTVTCPWHGSQFDLASGAVCRGPASAPQREFDVRIQAGKIEVRARR